MKLSLNPADDDCNVPRTDTLFYTTYYPNRRRRETRNKWVGKGSFRIRNIYFSQAKITNSFLFPETGNRPGSSCVKGIPLKLTKSLSGNYETICDFGFRKIIFSYPKWPLPSQHVSYPNGILTGAPQLYSRRVGRSLIALVPPLPLKHTRQ